MIQYLIIFIETNFVEVPKIHKICKICSPQKRCLTVNDHGFKMTDEEIIQKVRECHTLSVETQAESESEEEKCLIP